MLYDLFNILYKNMFAIRISYETRSSNLGCE
jgi:hypothetical protein